MALKHVSIQQGLKKDYPYFIFVCLDSQNMCLYMIWNCIKDPACNIQIEWHLKEGDSRTNHPASRPNIFNYVSSYRAARKWW